MMNGNLQPEQPRQPADPSRKTIVIKLFGVGDAGVAVVERMICRGFSAAMAAVMNTDSQSLASSSAGERLHLETTLLRGLGTGGDPARGQAVAEEQLPKLNQLCE